MIKRKKKINFGFIFLLSFIAILLAIFCIKNNQVNQIHSTLGKQGQQFQKKTIEALIFSSDEISKIQNAEGDEKLLNEIIDDMAENHWRKLSSEIKPMLADETLLENQKKSLKALIEKSILSQKYIVNYNYESLGSEINWNLLGRIKVTNNADIEFIFDEDVGYTSNGSYYNQSEIYWIKSNDNWKIVQSPIIIPDEFWNYYGKSY